MHSGMMCTEECLRCDSRVGGFPQTFELLRFACLGRLTDELLHITEDGGGGVIQGDLNIRHLQKANYILMMDT